jgi:DNA-binding MarR family transcriptional regulator
MKTIQGMAPAGARPSRKATGQRVTAQSKWQLLKTIEDIREPLGLKGTSISLLRAMISFLRVDHVDATRDDGHICFASNASLAKRAHVSIQTVERHIAKLVSLGLLTRRSSGNGKRWARRDRQGSVVLATGLSLLPLAERYPEFLRMAQDYQDLKNELGRLRDMCSAAMSNLKAHLMPANRDEGLLSKASCCSLTEARARSRCALAMGISVGHVQPQLLICYESNGQSGPPFETKLPTITHSQRPILKPKIDTCPVNLTSKQASPFSSQIHRTSWLSLPAKVVVAEHADTNGAAIGSA